MFTKVYMKYKYLLIKLYFSAEYVKQYRVNSVCVACKTYSTILVSMYSFLYAHCFILYQYDFLNDGILFEELN